MLNGVCIGLILAVVFFALPPWVGVVAAVILLRRLWQALFTAVSISIEIGVAILLTRWGNRDVMPSDE